MFCICAVLRCNKDSLIDVTDASSNAGAASDDMEHPTSTSSALSCEQSDIDSDSCQCQLIANSELVEGLSAGFCHSLAAFAGAVLQSRLLSTVALMNAIHRRCLETMISVAFDMAWDVICTPTRIKFARSKEVKNMAALCSFKSYAVEVVCWLIR